MHVSGAPLVSFSYCQCVGCGAELSRIKVIRDFCGHLPYLFQNPISNFYLSLEAGKSSTDSGILRKLTNVEIVFRAWTKSLKIDVF